MFNIFMKWNELRAYFTAAELAKSQFVTKFKARLLKEMLSDYKNYMFFEFATLVLQFERLNSLFQQTKAGQGISNSDQQLCMKLDDQC
jgi:hypothetical protein